MLKTVGFLKKIVFGVVVNALPIGLVATPIPGMPETDMGEVASIVTDLNQGRRIMKNDNIPMEYIIDKYGDKKVSWHDNEAANPVKYEDHTGLNAFDHIKRQLTGATNENYNRPTEDAYTTGALTDYGYKFNQQQLDKRINDEKKPDRYRSYPESTYTDVTVDDRNLRYGFALTGKELTPTEDLRDRTSWEYTYQ